jgi:hypothetical protein
VPKRPNCRCHVGDKENAEYADNRVEVSRRETQIEHVAQPELRVSKATPGGLGSSEFEQPFRKVDAKDEPSGAHHYRCGERRGPASTAHI